MAGGDALVYERVLPVMDCYSKACTLIGAAGCGQLAKMVNQICIAGVVQGLSEGLSVRADEITRLAPTRIGIVVGRPY